MESISTKLRNIRNNINQIAKQQQRNGDEVTLLAVAKTYSAETVFATAQCGQRHFGENYLQEAINKMSQIKNLIANNNQAFNDSSFLDDGNLQIIQESSSEIAQESSNDYSFSYHDLIWHFIGPIQRNKTKQIAENFQWVESVDRLLIAERLSEQRPVNLPPLQICLQVNIDDEATKGGCKIEEAYTLAKEIIQLPNIQLRGLMAIPRESHDYQQQLTSFVKIKQLYHSIQEQGILLDTLSIGMSGDYPAAIACGSTQIRIGSAIFGARKKIQKT